MTPEEAAIYVQAHRDGLCLEDVAELSDFYDRACAAIEATATSDLSDYYECDEEEEEDYNPFEHGLTLNVSFAADDEYDYDDEDWLAFKSATDKFSVFNSAAGLLFQSSSKCQIAIR